MSVVEVTPSQVVALACDGRLEQARALLTSQVERRVNASGDHVAWGRVCETLGLISLARREYQLALRDDPQDTLALDALAALHGLLGELEQEALLRRRLHGVAHHTSNQTRLQSLQKSLAVGSTQEIEARRDPKPRREPSLGDVSRFIHLFEGRQGVHARQWLGANGKGGYSPVHQPLTPSLVQAHLKGSMTLGSYVVRADDTVTFFALDLDVRKKALQAQNLDALRGLIHRTGLQLHRALSDLGLSPLLVDSGFKGRHLFVFLSRPMPARLMVRLGARLRQTIARVDGALMVEFFPKQSHVPPDGLGNLIKLPLGIHKRSGRRCVILDSEGQPLTKPWAALHRIERIQPDTIMATLENLKAVVEPETPEVASVKPPEPQRPAAFGVSSFEVGALRWLRGGCGVVRLLVQRALESRRLTHDEQLVLIHTLGHLPEGVEAVNYLFEQCPEIEVRRQLRQRLRGQPMSCPKIRKRVPETTILVDCFCHFPSRPDHYPTPLLHLDEAKAQLGKAEGVGGVDEEGAGRGTLERRAGWLRERIGALQKELGEVEEALSAGGPRPRVGARWSLVQGEDDAALRRWQASGSGQEGGDVVGGADARIGVGGEVTSPGGVAKGQGGADDPPP